MNSYLIGVDLGQSQDYSTIAVIERAELLGEFDPVLYASRKVVELRLRVLERIPLGTPYTEVAHRVAQVAAAPALSAGKRHLAIDGTGVGRPVLELVQRERPRATLMPLLVTGGERQSRSGGFYHVPKRDLIVGLQVMFEAGTLRIAKGLPFGTELVQELQSMDVRVTAWGREQYGAFRSGTHDDLVFAVALSCWAAMEVYPPGRRENQYWTNMREAARAEVFRKGVRKVET